MIFHLFQYIAQLFQQKKNPSIFGGGGGVYMVLTRNDPTFEGLITTKLNDNKIIKPLKACPTTGRLL